MTPTQHDSIVAHGALRLLAVGVNFGVRNRVIRVAAGRTVERLLDPRLEVSFLRDVTTTLPSSSTRASDAQSRPWRYWPL